MDHIDRWYPERFFYSHATSDNLLTEMVKYTLEQASGKYQVYVAERGIVGKPLIHKLREEILSSNAVLVVWTQNANKKATSQIVSFELGMAFSLGLPIYILLYGKPKLPWFFDKVTDYWHIPTVREGDIKLAISKIEPFTFCHPIDFSCPSEPYNKVRPGMNASSNVRIVRQDGTIVIPAGFDDILHFRVTNRRHRPERDVRLILQFPSQVKVTFNPGSLETGAIVQRNDLFDMRQTGPGEVRLYWPSFPPQHFTFELRLSTSESLSVCSDRLLCMLSSENLVGWRSKRIPIRLVQSTV